MSAKANLLKYMEVKSIKKADFYKITGISNGFLDKNSNISSNNLEIIISKFQDVSIEWLISGNGEMLRSAQTQEISITSLTATTEDKLLKIIENKDLKIELQAKEIGRLEQEVEQLKKLEKNNSDDYYEDVRSVGSAAAVG